jgi:hypothetical protein
MEGIGVASTVSSTNIGGIQHEKHGDPYDLDGKNKYSPVIAPERVEQDQKISKVSCGCCSFCRKRSVYPRNLRNKGSLPAAT